MFFPLHRIVISSANTLEMMGIRLEILHASLIAIKNNVALITDPYDTLFSIFILLEKIHDRINMNLSVSIVNEIFNEMP